MSRIHEIALTLTKHVGDRQAKKLLRAFGSARAIFEASRPELLAVEGIGELTARALLKKETFKDARIQNEFILKHGIRVLFYTDEAYPSWLKHCDDGPVILYLKGDYQFNQRKLISVVGSRSMSKYGGYLCERLIEFLRNYEVAVVSGLAYGVDIRIHEACLSAGIPTVAVLGHGLDRIYPAVHRTVAAAMLRQGGLLTEFLPGTRPERENFPKRNRIIAGISEAVVVVEASLGGGALITAELANSYDREVFAFPGQINEEGAAGGNFLIQTHRAHLLTSPEDIADYLSWTKPVIGTSTAALKMECDSCLNEQEQELMRMLSDGAKTLDQMARHTQMDQGNLAMWLLQLEIKGFLICLPGRIYQRA